MVDTQRITASLDRWNMLMCNGPLLCVPNIRNIIRDPRLTPCQRADVVAAIHEIVTWNDTFIRESVCSDCSRCQRLLRCTSALRRYIDTRHRTYMSVKAFVTVRNKQHDTNLEPLTESVNALETFKYGVTRNL